MGPKRQGEPLQLRERLRACQGAIDGGVTGREQARIVARRVQVSGERRGDIRESPVFDNGATSAASRQIESLSVTNGVSCGAL